MPTPIPIDSRFDKLKDPIAALEAWHTESGDGITRIESNGADPDIYVVSNAKWKRILRLLTESDCGERVKA